MVGLVRSLNERARSYIPSFSCNRQARSAFWSILDVNPESHRDLQLLEAFTDDQRVSQRTMASRLGIALGLTNLYVKRLARKGYIKCVNVRSNRILYLITP